MKVRIASGRVTLTVDLPAHPPATVGDALRQLAASHPETRAAWRTRPAARASPSSSSSTARASATAAGSRARSPKATRSTSSR